MNAFFGRGIFLCVDATSLALGVLAENDCSSAVRSTAVSTEFAGDPEDMDSGMGHSAVSPVCSVRRSKLKFVINLWDVSGDHVRSRDGELTQCVP